jgi:PadR family transcriptional regulator PadR
MDAQLRKGLLELCVLAVLRKEDSDLIEISESTLYPILRRLEMGGKVKSYTTQYNNRLRKYFHLTEEGRQYLKNFDKDRAQLLKILDYIAEEDEK